MREKFHEILCVVLGKLTKKRMEFSMKCFFLSVLFAAFLTVPSPKQAVPILMYHDFTTDAAGEFAVTVDRFDEHLTALENAGYHTVTFADLIEYVYFDGDLPENPVVITSDDGYTGVLELAADCAAEHNMTLSCAIIGSLAGINGHFALDAPIPDNVEIISHTFALHDREGWNGIVCADSMFSGYRKILTEDCETMKQVCEERFPYTSSVLVYPHGTYSDKSEQILHDLGYAVTVTCDRGIAKVGKGDAESLYEMPRISVWQNITGEMLLEMIESSKK